MDDNFGYPFPPQVGQSDLFFGTRNQHSTKRIIIGIFFSVCRFAYKHLYRIEYNKITSGGEPINIFSVPKAIYKIFWVNQNDSQNLFTNGMKLSLQNFIQHSGRHLASFDNKSHS